MGGNGQASSKQREHASDGMRGRHAVVELASVKWWFGAFHALKCIDLAVANGESIIVSPRWEQGSSILIRRIDRLEIHHGERVVADGVELTGNLLRAGKARAEAGMALPSFDLFAHLAVLDNLFLAPVWVKKMSHAEADAMAGADLERVPIRENAPAHTDQRSASRQQQQVAIARALCMNPRLMLVDKPASALDPAMIKEVLGVTADLAALGMIIWRCRA